MTQLHSTTRLRQEIKKLKKLVYVDELTGVLNRRGFSVSAEKLFREILIARKSKKDRRKLSVSEMAVLMIDFDHFKRINDTHGHDVGDKALRHIAQLIARRLRSFDLIGRWGGEEFVVALLGVSDWAAYHVAEDLRRLVEDVPLHAGGKHIEITASIGVKTVKKEIKLQRVIQSADKALYAAKHAGRNCVRVAR